MRRPFVFLVFLLPIAVSLGGACTREEPKKDDKKDEKASSDDDDKPAKKKKKKDKDEDKDKDGDEKVTPEDDASAKEDAGEDTKKDDGPPPPAVCAPGKDSPLGGTFKLLSSAGQPGASLAVWSMNPAPVVGTIAVTLSADKKCYVEYLTAPEASIADGVGIQKVYVSAASGKGEKTGATVAFRLAYSHGRRVAGGAQGIWQDLARFYGYAPANGIPYSCKPLPGEKNDRCAMYHAPLEITAKVACKKVDAKTGKFGVEPPLGAPSVILKGPVGSIVKPLGLPALPDGGVVLALPLPDAGVDGGADAGACADPECVTTAWLQKENERVYVRAAAGKPTACVGTGKLQVGDTWYFDESHWKKR